MADKIKWPLQTRPAAPARDPYNVDRWPENFDCPLLKAGKRYTWDSNARRQRARKSH